MKDRTHRSAELDKHIGRRVRLKMWDGRWEEGLLQTGGDYANGRYRLRRSHDGDLLFYKSHVKEIEEAR